MRTAGSRVVTTVATAVPITTLVNLLEAQVGHLVVDKTNLKGLFDYNVTFTPEGAPSTASVTAPGGAQTSDSEAPSLSTALEDDLGLRLERAEGPTEVLVIDSVSRPPEN